MNEELAIIIESPLAVLVSLDDGDIGVGVEADVEVVVQNSGPPGAPGTGSGFLHTQSVASASWIVNHNLGYRPLVTVYSPGGEIVIAQGTHASVNQYIVSFNSPQTGFTRCT